MYMAIRQAALDLGWSTVREEKDASVQWIDRWESAELSNLVAPRKVRHGLQAGLLCWRAGSSDPHTPHTPHTTPHTPPPCRSATSLA